MIRYFRLHTIIALILLFVLFCGTVSLQGQTSLAALESEMVLVEGGSMDIQGRLVTLPSFYCSKFEVTQGLFEEIMGYNPIPSTIPALYHPLNPIGQKYDEKQIEFFIFCNELNKRLNLPYIYYKNAELNIPFTILDLGSTEDIFQDTKSNGYRLPISVEWEYAARGGNKSLNYTYSGSNNPDDVGWTSSNSSAMWHIVGQLRPNEIGLYDMTGNINELVFDIYTSHAFPSCKDLWEGGGRYFEKRGCGSYPSGQIDCVITKRSASTDLEKGFRLFRNAK